MNKPNKVLGIRKNATKSEIKRAFREKIKENHPDHGGDKYTVQEIIRAKKKMLNQNQTETKKKFSVIQHVRDYFRE